MCLFEVEHNRYLKSTALQADRSEKQNRADGGRVLRIEAIKGNSCSSACTKRQWSASLV